MDNYHYIIAGLPELVLNGENKSFSYTAIKDEIFRECSLRDQQLIRWLEFGANDANLNSHFYCAALSHKNPFISNYFKMDLQIRNKTVEFLSRPGKAKQDPAALSKYQININKDLEMDPDDAVRLQTVFETSNILEKEQMLDKYKWEKINAFTVFNYFDINTILAFLAKARMIDRWNKLDKNVGREMFKKLVDEVRGTFKGINYKE